MAIKSLSHAEVSKRLKAAGFKDTGETYSGESGDYGIWITSWGEPLMVPQDGPDKTCAEIFLHQRMEKVLATKPKK